MDLLIVSQVYPPDPASVGQHLRDVAQGMTQRGFKVGVISSARGYADPRQRYLSDENESGVHITRVAWGSFGKHTAAHRVLGGGWFLLRAAWDILCRRPASVLVSTSPPFAPVVALVCRILGIPCVAWIMDLNPAQAVAVGWVTERSILVRIFHRLNALCLKSCAHIVSMDSAMLHRIRNDYGPMMKADVVPPWPHVMPDDLRPQEDSVFRRENGWGEKFVVMYSGNHSLANPLTTVLEAAERLDGSEAGIHFAFVGAGVEKEKVEARALGNVTSLPYQPFEQLEDSLGAADLHVVTMGEAMLGIVHPCKIYGAMAVGRPILGVAPEGSHVHQILADGACGWWVRHGDVNGAVAAILECRKMNSEDRLLMGARAQHALRRSFSKEVLCGRICDIIQTHVQT